MISCGQAANQNILFVGLRFSIHDVSQRKIASNLSRDCKCPVIEKILMIICSLHAFIYFRLYTILDIYLLNKFSLNSGYLAEIIVFRYFQILHLNSATNGYICYCLYVSVYFKLEKYMNYKIFTEGLFHINN